MGNNMRVGAVLAAAVAFTSGVESDALKLNLGRRADWRAFPKVPKHMPIVRPANLPSSAATRTPQELRKMLAASKVNAVPTRQDQKILAEAELIQDCMKKFRVKFITKQVRECVGLTKSIQQFNKEKDERHNAKAQPRFPSVPWHIDPAEKNLEKRLQEARYNSVEAAQDRKAIAAARRTELKGPPKEPASGIANAQKPTTRVGAATKGFQPTFREPAMITVSEEGEEDLERLLSEAEAVEMDELLEEAQKAELDRTVATNLLNEMDPADLEAAKDYGKELNRKARLREQGFPVMPKGAAAKRVKELELQKQNEQRLRDLGGRVAAALNRRQGQTQGHPMMTGGVVQPPPAVSPATLISVR